jgi:hypothetical protein
MEPSGEAASTILLIFPVSKGFNLDGVQITASPLPTKDKISQ